MSDVLLHELATTADDLVKRLRVVLGARSDPGAIALLARCRLDDRARPTMVFTGQYSGGKSLLISALTKRAYDVISAGPDREDEEAVLQLRRRLEGQHETGDRS